MKIGLTLSGGGFRATGFHLGVLARLAEANLLEQVVTVSTVSGGSLCAGLVYATNHFAWPTSSQYFDQVLPQARQILMTQDLQEGILRQVLRDPLSILDRRANSLSQLLQERWGITARLRDIPQTPRWLINTTCYETGKNWRFESFRMGDYEFGYSNNTDLPVADAVAASSGFPGLIGSLWLDTRPYKWFQYDDAAAPATGTADASQAALKTKEITPEFPIVHLWDGGVYDNFGLEGVFDIDKGWRQDVDFLVVCDAAGKPPHEKYRPGIPSFLRIITGVMMDQIHALRTRTVMQRLVEQQEPGVLVRCGNSCERVIRNSRHKAELAVLQAQCLETRLAEQVADFPTMIKKLTADQFERLFQHGYEVADYTLYAYGPADAKFIGYGQSRCYGLVSPGKTAPAIAAGAGAAAA